MGRRRGLTSWIGCIQHAARTLVVSGGIPCRWRRRGWGARMAPPQMSGAPISAAPCQLSEGGAGLASAAGSEFRGGFARVDREQRQTPPQTG